MSSSLKDKAGATDNSTIKVAKHGEHNGLNTKPNREVNDKEVPIVPANTTTSDSVHKSTTSSNESNHEQKKPTTAAKPAGGLKSKLPPWLFGHFNAKDMKTLFRCALAGWAALFFLVINPVLHNFGQAAFFAVYVICVP